MEGGGPFNLQPGDWTDDTSMALCLAESLIECGDFDPVDQLTRYVRWMREGTSAATASASISVEPSTLRSTDSNDPVNRGVAAPTSAQPATAPSCGLRPCRCFSRTHRRLRSREAPTVPAPRMERQEAVDACRYMAGLIVGALQGKSKEELLEPLFTPVPGLWGREPLAPKVHAVADGSFLRKEPPQIRGSGYVVESLEAALWAFGKSTSFEHGALLAVNLGRDADTTGAVYGQIAGAYYGVEAIPERWRLKLARREMIEGFAVRLLRSGSNNRNL